MICELCGRKFHYCSSCGFVCYGMDEGYCSDECWRKSDEYKEAFGNFKNFIKNMDKEELTFLLSILDGEYDSYEMDFFDYVKETCKKI